MKTVTIAFAVLFSSCFNAVHNKDAVKNNGTFSFQHCNQTLGAKFIESNCTKAWDYRTENMRICSECATTRFKLSKDSLIYTITIDSLTIDEFNKYHKDFTSQLGAPREMESADDYSYYWKLFKEDKMITLIKRAYPEKNKGINHILNIDDINAFGLE